MRSNFHRPTMLCLAGGLLIPLTCGPGMAQDAGKEAGSGRTYADVAPFMKP